MAFESKNPVKESMIFNNHGVAGVSNPPTGKLRIIHRDNKVYAQDDTGTETELAAAVKPKVQEKILSSDVTTSTTFLQFNSLVPGRRYRFIASLRCTAGTAADSDIMVITLKNGTTTLVENLKEVNISSSSYRWTETFNKPFTCDVGQTTVFLETGMSSASFTIQALGGGGTSYAEIMDVTDTEEVTTDFT